METVLERLDEKLRTWDPDIADDVRRRLEEMLELADQGVLDLARDRRVEQEVLDLLDDGNGGQPVTAKG
jgi:hypothetical protein